MKLSIKGVALAAGIFWALAALLTAIANMIVGGYGYAFLSMLASLYPGYEVGTSAASIALVTVYALVDGIICGAIFAWLYNRFAT